MILARKSTQNHPQLLRTRQKSFQIKPNPETDDFNAEQIKLIDFNQNYLEYSRNTKLKKTFTIGTKYILQLEKIFTLVNFESAQNIFKKLSSGKDGSKNFKS